jgi:phosphatidylethanolamine/phosphatidyl-N-methylethanolamine N-methyltransferase
MNVDDYYENHYEKVVNSGLVGKFADHYHFQMEKDFENKKFGRVLELGAGKGQHINFVKHEFDRYIQTDIRITNDLLSKLLTNSEWMVADAQNLVNFGDNEFERLISTCLLAHLPDPESSLKEWRRVTEKNGGVISIYVPCEPSFLLRFAQKISTRRKAEKLGVDYSSMHYREHRNHYFFLKTLIFDTFKNDNIKVISFPSRFAPFDLKLYEIYQIRLEARGDESNE